MIDINTLRAMAKLMESESDEPGDIRGLRARAVTGALDEIERLTAALKTTRTYIDGSMIAGAVVVPTGEKPRGDHPSLLAYIDAALNHQEPICRGIRIANFAASTVVR